MPKVIFFEDTVHAKNLASCLIGCPATVHRAEGNLFTVLRGVDTLIDTHLPYMTDWAEPRLTLILGVCYIDLMAAAFHQIHLDIDGVVEDKTITGFEDLDTDKPTVYFGSEGLDWEFVKKNAKLNLSWIIRYPGVSIGEI